jgi:hypothetical protein
MSNITNFYIFVAVLGFMLLAIIISYGYVAWKNRYILSGGKIIKRNRKKTK